MVTIVLGYVFIRLRLCLINSKTREYQKSATYNVFTLRTNTITLMQDQLSSYPQYVHFTNLII